MEEAQRKQAQLQEAIEQLQAKVHPGLGEGRAHKEEEGKSEQVGLDPLATYQNPARKNTLLFFLSPSFAYLQKQVVMEKLRTAQKQWQLQQVGPSP